MHNPDPPPRARCCGRAPPPETQRTPGRLRGTQSPDKPTRAERPQEPPAGLPASPGTLQQRTGGRRGGRQQHLRVTTRRRETGPQDTGHGLILTGGGGGAQGTERSMHAEEPAEHAKPERTAPSA